MIYKKVIFPILISVLLLHSQTLFSQETYKDKTAEVNAKTFENNRFYTPKQYIEPKKKRPKNVIFFIGDGMGMNQLSGGLAANHNNLYLKNFCNIGFTTTFSQSDFTTDSAAAGTALASGKKTYNGGIGVNSDSIAVENIRELAARKGLSTGVVSTSAVTHATPASFVAHQSGRGSYEAIASDFLKTDIDLFIGGGYKHFAERKDSLNLIDSLIGNGYQVVTDWTRLTTIRSGKLAALLAPEHLPAITEGRGEILPTATQTAIDILSQNKKGFFVMIEGSQVDWGGHQNNTGYVVSEVLDLDQAIGRALDFAVKNKETLIIVTSDHETGGFAVENGDFNTGKIVGNFTTKSHTGVMVPVYAFGPGAENFRGFYDNTDIPKKIGKLLGIEMK